MKVQEVMSANVITTTGKTKLSSVKGLFNKHNISSAPVLKDNGEIEGIISSTDVAAIHNEDLLVRDVMTKRVHVCAVNARIKDVGNTMIKENIHHIVVMEDGKVAGVLSALDIIKGLLKEA
jgi:CBS domain-containing protein